MMKAKVLMASFAAAIALGGIARAENFDFEVTGNTQYPGTVSGIIYGLASSNTKSVTSSPTGVVIVSSTLPSVTYPYTFNPASYVVGTDTFTVEGGQIVGASFEAITYNGADYVSLELNAHDTNGLGEPYHSVNNTDGFSGATYTPVASAVPEPSTWALTLLGIGGIGYAFRRAKKDHGFPFARALLA